jgi:hypothetical protein
VSVRWRVGVNGAEWFWGGHWQPCTDTQMQSNLLKRIYAVTAAYPDTANTDEVDLKRLIA